MSPGMDFDHWFQKATGDTPYPYQKRFAIEDAMPQLVDIPPGLGKMAMAALGDTA